MRGRGAGVVVLVGLLALLQPARAAAQAQLTAAAPIYAETVGDGDGYIEPGEEGTVSVQLENTGDAPATGITATLTSPAGIILLGGTATYPDLAPSAIAVNQGTLSFVTSAVFPCGTATSLTLTVTFAGGTSPLVLDLPFSLGAPGGQTTYTYTGGPVAIPDGADLSGTMPGTPAVADLVVAGFSGPIYDVDLRFDGSACTNAAGATTVGIEHTFMGDLDVTLRSPAGTNVVAVGTRSTNGSGNNFCQTFLDDESSGESIQMVTPAQAPYTGSFLPNQRLSGFDGEDANGTWHLQAQDFATGDTGNIRAFSVLLTPAVCDAPGRAAVLSATKTVTGTFTVGGTVTYTIVVTNTGNGTSTDGTGDEMSDMLPPELLVGTPTADGGSVSGAGVNPVTWNGAIPPGGSVTITIPATIQSGSIGQTISNQASVAWDLDRDLVNESSAETDGPDAVPNDPTTFVIGSGGGGGGGGGNAGDHKLAGKKLLVTQKKSTQRLLLLADDPGIVAAQPCALAGELAVESAGGSHRITLDPSGWKPLKKKKSEKGCKYARPGGPSIVIKPGKLLKLRVAGPDLGVPLTADPRPVRLGLRQGDVRLCVEFGGQGKLTAGKKLLSKASPAPADCPL